MSQLNLVHLDTRSQLIFNNVNIINTKFQKQV